jgi:tetratricopeptide (TPR) repeat protein
LCAGVLWMWKVHKKQTLLYLFFALWFLLGVGFHMQLLPLDMTVADHMFYFPMIGLLGVIGLTLQNIKITNYNVLYTTILLAVITICFFLIRTFIRNTNWYNGISLYSNDLQYQPNDRIENLLATQLFQAGQYSQAQQYFEDVLSRNRQQPALIFNLAEIYESEGNIPQAENLYKSSLSFDDTGILYSNYARILMLRDGKVKQAKEISKEGLSKYPQNTTLILIDAIATYKLGDKQTALKEVQQAENTAHDPRYDQIYQGIKNDNLTL